MIGGLWASFVAADLAHDHAVGREEGIANSDTIYALDLLPFIVTPPAAF